MTLLPELFPPLPNINLLTLNTLKCVNPFQLWNIAPRLSTALSLSFRERTIFLSFYVLSIPLYLHSTLLPTSSLLQHYTRIIRRVLCPRPWVQAEHLPGIIRYFKLGILHCPQISLLAALLGYCVRCYGENIATWLCFISPELPPMPEQLQQGLRRIRSALVEANTYNVSSFVESFQEHVYNSLPNHKLAKKLTSALKAHLLQRLLFDTRAFLRRRISQVPWLFTSGSPLLDVLHTTPLKAIPCHTRLAMLRWLIDSEPDLHFRLRPYIFLLILSPLSPPHALLLPFISLRSPWNMQEGLPHFHGPAPALSTPCLANAVVGVFPPNSPLIKQLFQFQQTYPQPPNCTLEFKPCSCGHIHGYLTALLPLPKGAPLHVGDPPTHLSDFVIQFDGGAYRDLKIGGAGVILWRHTHGALEPLDSLGIPIYPCADAAHAEA